LAPLQRVWDFLEEVPHLRRWVDALRQRTQVLLECAEPVRTSFQEFCEIYRQTSCTEAELWVWRWEAERYGCAYVVLEGLKEWESADFIAFMSAEVRQGRPEHRDAIVKILDAAEELVRQEGTASLLRGALGSLQHMRRSLQALAPREWQWIAEDGRTTPVVDCFELPQTIECDGVLINRKLKTPSWPSSPQHVAALQTIRAILDEYPMICEGLRTLNACVRVFMECAVPRHASLSAMCKVYNIDASQPYTWRVRARTVGVVHMLLERLPMTRHSKLLRGIYNAVAAEDLRDWRAALSILRELEMLTLCPTAWPSSQAVSEADRAAVQRIKKQWAIAVGQPADVSDERQRTSP
jgi:hypothetical protein